MPTSPKRTIPRQFRLRPETLAELDLIARHLTELTGRDSNRTDAIRYAARRLVETIPPAPEKKGGHRR